MRAFIRFVFYLLYHPFAWAYDLVAAVVSLGHWNEWVRRIIPLIEGSRVLELGFGPGHLQVELEKRGFLAFGLDESRPMVRQASRRLLRKGLPLNLVRGLSQHLPFRPVFETVIATFPSEYIFDPDTIREVHRALVPGGRLIVLLSVLITLPLRQGQAPQGIPPPVLNLTEERVKRISQRFAQEGFIMETRYLPGGWITLLIFSGKKPLDLEPQADGQT